MYYKMESEDKEMKEKISNIVCSAISEMNEDLEDGEKIVYAKDSALFGKGEGVDSFSFVSLVSNIEDRIYDEFEKEVFLVTPEVYDREDNPFETIGALECYIAEVIAEA